MGSRKELKSTHSAANTSSSDGGAYDNSSPLRKQESRSAWTSKSWPHGRKAAAVTEVARESISVSGNVASESSTSTTALSPTRSPNRPKSIQLIKKAGASNRSLPADATTTRLTIDSNGPTSESPDTNASSEPSPAQSNSTKHENNGIIASIADSTGAEDSSNLQTSKNTESSTEIGAPETKLDSNEQPPNSWFSWLAFGRASVDKAGSKGSDMAKEPERPESTSALVEEPQLSEIGANPDQVNEEHGDGQANVSTRQNEEDTVDPVPQRRSWMQIWRTSNTTTGKTKESTQKDDPVESPRVDQDQPIDEVVNGTASNETLQPQPQIDQLHSNDSQKRVSGPAKSNGWAFWSKDVSSTENLGPGSRVETGELALPEQHKVESNREEIVAQLGTTPSSVSTPKSQNKTQKKAPRSATVKDAQNGDSADENAVPTLTTQTSAAPAPIQAKVPDTPASTKLESVLTNQLLPSFKETYALQESPSWLQTLGRMLYSRKDSGSRHVCTLRDPPKPKRALAIGVHGYFPAPYLRTVLGQPTGTSLKFSTMAAKAIHKWAENHGYDCDVEKIALEGEGRIAERVDLLWKLLLRWIEEIRKAEFIMFACHSQGVPVTIMLVAKLIAFGCLEATRVGICAMAGVNLGPFPDYRSRWIGGSAGELFDFAHPTTKVSREYEAALKTALDFGVRISYIGSIDDQLVSLESSLFVPVSHPYIYRAVFVDGRVHAPSFLSHLVGFALKLRNLGIHDHGLVRELSAPLVGSLVGGEGHSRLHDEENIYYVAIQFALETSTVNGALLHIQRYLPTSPPNPYILPFALRGLLEEDYVRHELHDESLELLKQFDEWKPTTKALRDVKFRLEGIRSKL